MPYPWNALLILAVLFALVAWLGWAVQHMDEGQVPWVTLGYTAFALAFSGWAHSRYRLWTKRADWLQKALRAEALR